MRSVVGSGLLLAGLLIALLAALPTTPVGSAATPTTGAGELVFRTKGCIACHSVARLGLRAAADVGPDLSSVAEDARRYRPGLSAPAYVSESVRTPRAFVVPGYQGQTFGMPTLGLTDDEIEVIASLLLAR